MEVSCSLKFKWVLLSKIALKDIMLVSFILESTVLTFVLYGFCCYIVSPKGDPGDGERPNFLVSPRSVSSYTPGAMAGFMVQE